jgi:hypothetical protein
MVRNVIECESALGVYDLSAERGVCRLYEMKGRSSCRNLSDRGHVGHLRGYNHMSSGLVVDTDPRSFDMNVIHSTQVPDAMVVDKVLKRWAMVVH